MNRALLVLGLPLALLSWLWFLAERGMWRRLLASQLGRGEPSWRVVDRKALDLPVTLPILMATAPRWNPHALVAGCGPFEVKQRIEVDAGAMRASAGEFTVVANATPGQRTVGAIDRNSTPDDGFGVLALPPGRYQLALRYYRLSSSPRLPEIRVDGVSVVSSREVAPDTNEALYGALSTWRKARYRLLHHHVVPFLHLAELGWLSRSFVDRMLLPVGNPETTFHYGPCTAGEVLAVRAPADALDRADVYVAFYGRDSIPLSWRRLERLDERLVPPEHGFYVVRVYGGDPAQRPDVRVGPA